MDPDTTNNTPQQTPLQPPQQPVIQKEITYKKRIFFILCICIIFLVSVTFVFIPKPHTTVQNKLSSTQQSTLPKPTVIPEKNSEVTKETNIAKTLDVPSLYPNVAWKDVTDATHDAILNKLYISKGDSLISYKFKGKYWNAMIKNESYYNVGSYYYSELQKNGWVEQGGSGALEFKDFSFNPQSEGGPCGGSNSFIGYKDGLVRLVTVSEQTISCEPDGVTRASTITDVNVFVSDTTSLKDIMTYITTR